MTEATFDITKDLVPQITMTVKVKGMAEWRIRLWVATHIMKFAARIMNIGVIIDIEV